MAGSVPADWNEKKRVSLSFHGIAKKTTVKNPKPWTGKQDSNGPRMRTFTVLLLAITALVTAATALSDGDMNAFTPAPVSQQAPALSPVTFSVSAPAPEEGQGVDFTLVVTNGGNTVTAAQAQAYIFNSAYLPVATFNYANFTIGRGETLTLTKAWSTGGKPPGSYTAFANVSYDGKVTNPLFASFRIEPPSPPTGIVIAPNVSVVVLPQPPQIILPPANAWLLAYPVLKEMSPGDNALIFPLLENQGPDAIYADAVPAGLSAALASAVRGVLLPPDKPTTVIIPIQVPQDVPPGYYALTIEYSLNGSGISQPLIIHVVPPRAAGLSVYREISIDRQQNNSVMRLRAVNRGAWPIGHAEVFEQVPPAFDLQGMSFIVPPTATDKQLIRWDLVNVLSNETRMLSYVLPGIPDNPELLTLWPSGQTLIIEPDSYRHILTGGFEAPDIGPGEKGNYVLKLFNAGPSDETVAVRITGAEGWGLEPDSFNVSIHSRATSDLNFSLTSPADAPDPVYTLTVYLDYAGIRDQKTLLVPLNHERLVTMAPSPLSQQLLGWVARNANLLVLAVLACVAVSLAIRLGYAELRKPRYSRKRVDSLMKLQQMFGDDENRR